MTHNVLPSETNDRHKNEVFTSIINDEALLSNDNHLPIYVIVPRTAH